MEDREAFFSGAKAQKAVGWGPGHGWGECFSGGK